MKRHYLEVTYRKGRPLAAYLYLPRRADDRSARVEHVAPSLNVDYAADGRPIGIKMLDPTAATLDVLNELLARIHAPTVDRADLAPLAVV